MQIANNIEALIRSSKNSTVFGNIVYNLMTNLNQPYSEIMSMPLPLVFELLKILEKQNKDMEKEMKKKHR